MLVQDDHAANTTHITLQIDSKSLEAQKYLLPPLSVNFPDVYYCIPVLIIVIITLNLMIVILSQLGCL